ncbi:MAG TPA: S9 family peptidase, partial [Rubricoccaceae bacterium]
RFKDLVTGELYPDTVFPATPSMAWAADSRTLFVARQDLETLRSFQVLRHTLGEPEAPVVYQEDDDTFSVGVRLSKDRRFVLVRSSQTLTSEWRFVPADAPRGAFETVRPRVRGVEYDADHVAGRWVVRTNEGGAENFKLMSAPTDDPGAWTETVAARPDVLLEEVDAFADALVTQEREGGLRRLRVRGHDGALRHDVAFAESAYTVELVRTPDAGSGHFRYVYESLTTPAQTTDYTFDTHAATVVKQQPVLGGFDAAQYTTERRWAVARDGARVPLSVVRRRDTPLDGTAPLLLYGYGSYGFSMEPWFNAPLVSLLDRGFVYAVAHVRGGQEMGRAWYEAGKLGRKMNTFTDFIDAAEALVADGVADPERLYAEGGSAGGLLVGAAMNLRPDLWDGVVAEVPFVDVVTTMLDDTIPLTTGEYDEWGNPNEPEAFRTMLAYSPVDNVRPQAYPALLVTTGLHDSQVQYWEPAKWVARLRDAQTGPAPILLKTEMEAGHGGPSGRFRQYRETAFTYAWLLDQAGLAD